MLQTKEFYEVMKSFEDFAIKNLRLGSQGFQKEEKESWKKQSYYKDGQMNEYFKIYLSGFSFGKFTYQN